MCPIVTAISHLRRRSGIGHALIEEIGVTLVLERQHPARPKKKTGGTQPVSIRAALPLLGLGVAVIVNAIWIGFLGYLVLRLI